MPDHNVVVLSHMSRGHYAACCCGWVSPWEQTREDARDLGDAHQAAAASEWEVNTYA